MEIKNDELLNICVKIEEEGQVTHASVDLMKKYLKEGHFMEGSMKPKVESAINFLKTGGKKAIIANLYDLVPAVEGKTGTQIIPNDFSN